MLLASPDGIVSLRAIRPPAHGHQPPPASGSSKKPGSEIYIKAHRQVLQRVPPITVPQLLIEALKSTITFDAENVWNRPGGSVGKILFIWTRYFGLSSLIVAVTILFHGSLSNKVSIFIYPFSCSGFFWWEAISHSITVLNVSVYAVYNNNKRLLCGLAGLCLMSPVVVGVICLGLPPIDGLTGCYASTTSPLLGLSFLPSSVTEIALCSCMLYKAGITYKYNHGSPLLKVLVADRSAFIVFTFVALLTNILVVFIAPRGLVEIALG
ncbi:hypothetical protein JB92DRAFT_2841678 [Gautieria morchelliformis]|nr:hypothetical protein JB92DRAFT_2841678 [Gautieria morchelliformis]